MPTRMDDLRMMVEEKDWPAWPVLPLKKKHRGPGLPELGVLVAGNGSKVYLGDMYEVRRRVLAGGVADVKCVEFENFGAIASAGWMVD